MKTTISIIILVVGSILGLPSTALAQNPHECNFCHVTHGAPGPGLLAAADIEVLCLSCHGPAGTSSLRATVHTNSTSFSMTCIDCHTPHSSRGNWLLGTNIKQVGRDVDASGGTARILTPNSGIREVVFESRGLDASEPSLHSFADNDEDGNGYYDGVCETCHTQTDYHRNNTPDSVHYPGATCTDCHPHEDGFMPTGGSCLDCHNATQGSRRAVVAEFSLASHHVPDGSLADSDCTVCHDMSQHQQGAVRLKNVDDLTVVALSADPAVDPAAAASLESFCLACHDADGAGGSAPFTSAVMPPALDAVAWAAASHQSQLTCYGDGAFGCHSSGHGSNKINLLSPYDVAATPPANAEEEEGFCFNCHDSDGPASTDVQSLFSLPIRWVNARAGVGDGTGLNDRHDVQYDAQVGSGAKIECTDCHDPHTATEVNPLKADPDPSDGRVPGTGQVLSGADFHTEWCLDCHDGSFPSSITPPTTTLASVWSTYQNDDAHGLLSGNAQLKSGYGWAAGDLVPCFACHTRYHISPKQNLFQLKDLVLSKDGTTAVPSDNVGLNYEVTNNNIKNAAINGYEWCNTCHTNSMGSKKGNCFNCHYHTDRF